MKSDKGIITKIDKQGRLVVPVELREQLGMQPETKVVVKAKAGILEVETLSAAIDRSHGIARRMIPGLEGRSIVDEFLAERRAEAARE